MPKKKVEVYDKDQLIYPYIESDHVTLSNGMGINEMLDQDVSMPTVTHDETSFKVGVGDSDVSSSIVDSSVGKMVIKGQTYQNILPEPSTHVLSNNKEMFKVNEGLDPNVEIVDGVSKSAILKGQTLVNVDSYYSTDDFFMHNIDTISSDGYIKLTANGTWRNSFTKFNGMLKPNTKYLAVVDIKTNTLANGTRPFRMFTNGTNSDGTVVNVPFVDQEKDIECGVTGTFKYILTTRGDLSTITTTSRNFISNTVTSGVIEYRYVLIEYQDGMENWDIPFFRGIQSVKMPVLHTVGKNLFDGILKQGYIGDASGEANTSKAGVHSPNYMKVKPNTTYIRTITGSYPSGVSTRVYFYDMNKTYLGIYKDGTTFTTPENAQYMRFRYYVVSGEIAPNDFSESNIQLEEGSTATPYEPYKSNILHTPEEVTLRSLPNDTKDTLNLNTGEYVQRVGEVTLNGSEEWSLMSSPIETDTIGFTYPFPNAEHLTSQSSINVISHGYPTLYELWNLDKEGISIYKSSTRIAIKINRNKLLSQDIVGFKTYLQSNPITVQYELTTPTIKTVDLSTSGNWEKVVLDGKSSENWQQNTHSGNFVQFEGYSNFCLYSMNLPVSNRGLLCDKFSYYGYDSKFRYTKIEGISDGGGYRLIFVRVKTEKLPTNDVAGFRQWLSQNPIEVSYMLSSNKDSTQVKQPIFFKDGHIQLSSGVENSLIPTLDYQAKTSNSYVMDLMKPNTKYTMKAKTASGTFTIDGTSYNIGTNTTFTSPSSMTNKFLVMSDKTNEEVMILEGDLTSKTIPYFKGIKSAFEGEDKIEVLSTGKNLINFKEHTQEWGGAYISNEGGNRITFTPNANGEGGINATFELANKVSLKAGATLTYSCRRVSGGNSDFIGTINNQIVLTYVDGTTKNIFITDFQSSNFDKTIITTFTLEKDCIKIITAPIMYTVRNLHSPVVIEYQLEVSDKVTDIESYKSNTTKIPLLHPLRSLPNGVCDKIILDRENNKAQIIQRIGEVVLDGSEDWVANSTLNTTKTTFFYLPNPHIPSTWGRISAKWSRLPNNRFVSTEDRPFAVNQKIEWISGGDGSTGMIQILINTERLSTLGVSSFKKWLSLNPITVHYELETPIITEVDLEGFPYIYKDGHIFLNSDIAPTAQITYSINQAQQIESANENLQRHEKEISHLQKLIAQYIQVDYESALLSLKV